MKTTHNLKCSFFLFFGFTLYLCFNVITPFQTKDKTLFLNLLQKANTLSTTNTTSTTSNNSTSKQTTTTGSSQANQSKNPKQISDINQKKIKEYTDQAKKSTELFLKTIKDIKGLISKIKKSEKIQKEVNKTVHNMHNITKGYKKKINIFQIRTEIKLNKINKNIMTQLKNQFYSVIHILKHEYIQKQTNIQLLNFKIDELLLKLPELDSSCSQYYSCSTCVKDHNCGWCGMTHTCMEGNSNGPTSGVCMFFNYGACSGKKDCDTYNDCKDCIRDTACGWCNRPGNPECINVEDFNQKTCREDEFVQIKRSLNICPHKTLNTYRLKLLKKLDDEKYDISVKDRVHKVTIDPKELMVLQKELDIYEKKKEEEIKLLKELKRSLKNTNKSIKELERDDYIFYHYYNDKKFNQENLHNTIVEMYKVIKEFVIDYRIYKLNKNLKKKPKPPRIRKQKVYKILADGTILEDNKAIKSLKAIPKLNNETKKIFSDIVNKTNIKKLSKKPKKKQVKILKKKNNKSSKSYKKISKGNKKNKTFIKSKSFKKKISNKNYSKTNSSSEFKSLIKNYNKDKKLNKSKSKICNKTIKKTKKDKYAIKTDREEESNSIYQTIKKYLNNMLHPIETSKKFFSTSLNSNNRVNKTKIDTIKVKLCNISSNHSNLTNIKHKKLKKNNVKILKSNSTTVKNLTIGIQNDIEDLRNENGYETLRNYENNQGFH